MAAHTPRGAGPAVRTVAHASLLRHTHTAREQVQALADDHTTDALTVVSAATDAYRGRCCVMRSRCRRDR
jgi:hypothetical protein